MAKHSFKIKAPLSIHKGTIEMDGKRLNGVYGVDVHLDANDVNRIVLRMYAADVDIDVEAEPENISRVRRGP